MTPPLMLFAAGLGTRMRPLTADRPKPMVEVAGRPLIDHALALADEAGVERRVANTHYRPETLEAHLARRGVTAVREAPEVLDTGGGLRNALPLLAPEGPVLVLNTDAVWRGPNPLGALTAAWRDGMDALLLVMPVGRCRGRTPPGDFAMDEGGRLSFGGDWVYLGAHVCDPAILDGAPEGPFSLRLPWRRLAAEGRLRGLAWKGDWCDVGTPAGIALAEEMLGDAAAREGASGA